MRYVLSLRQVLVIPCSYHALIPRAELLHCLGILDGPNNFFNSEPLLGRVPMKVLNLSAAAMVANTDMLTDAHSVIIPSALTVKRALGCTSKSFLLLELVAADSQEYPRRVKENRL